MSDPPFRPLDQRVIDLLAIERARPGPPSSVKATVRARLSSSLDTGLAGSELARRAVVSRSLAPTASIVIAFVTGGLVGGAIHAATSPAVPRDPPLGPAISMVVPSPAAPASAGLVEAREPSPPPTSGTREFRSNSESNLQAERALLDKARSALGRGDSAECLAVIKAHTETFARGRLVEEREALAVKALVHLGRADEARQRGARFRAHYPRSLLLPAVENALDSIP